MRALNTLRKTIKKIFKNKEIKNVYYCDITGKCSFSISTRLPARKEAPWAKKFIQVEENAYYKLNEKGINFACIVKKLGQFPLYRKSHMRILKLKLNSTPHLLQKHILGSFLVD